MNPEDPKCRVKGCDHPTVGLVAPMCMRCWKLVPHNSRVAVRTFYRAKDWISHAAAVDRCQWIARKKLDELAGQVALF